MREDGDGVNEIERLVRGFERGERLVAREVCERNVLGEPAQALAVDIGSRERRPPGEPVQPAEGPSAAAAEVEHAGERLQRPVGTFETSFEVRKAATSYLEEALGIGKRVHAGAQRCRRQRYPRDR